MTYIILILEHPLQRRRQSQDSARDLRNRFKNHPRLGSSATQLGCRRTGTGDGGTPSRAQVDAADRGLRASTMGGFEPIGNLRDWQTAASRNRIDLRSEALPGNAASHGGAVKASGSARHTEQRARSERNAGGVGGRANNNRRRSPALCAKPP